MSQIVQLKGEQISHLSKLVKKVGEQQRDLILEFSQEINQHNELIEKACEKQTRMEHKIERIETKIMEKEIYNYQIIQDKIERRKVQEQLRKKSFDLQTGLDYIQKLEEQKEHVLQLAENDDGFASCGEEDDETVKKTNEDFKDEMTGDPIHDQYLFMKTITNKEERKYLMQGKQAVIELMDILNPEPYTFEKTYQGADIYKRESFKNMVYQRIEVRYDFPPELVIEYMINLEKRWVWDGYNYEEIKCVRQYAMNTQLVKVKLKQQWPLGNRELLLLFHGFQLPDKNIILTSKSVEHKDFPEDPKVLRVNTHAGHFYLSPENDGKTTYLVYISEFDFKGAIPKYLVHKAASATWIDSQTRLKKLLAKLHPDQMFVKQR